MTFNSRLFLDLGGVTLELRHLPGHTSDCIVGWIPEWGVLLGGDAIETPLPVVNSEALLGGWLSALQDLGGIARSQAVDPVSRLDQRAQGFGSDRRLFAVIDGRSRIRAAEAAG